MVQKQCRKEARWEDEEKRGNQLTAIRQAVMVVGQVMRVDTSCEEPAAVRNTFQVS